MAFVFRLLFCHIEYFFIMSQLFFALLMSVLLECWNITEGWGTTATIGWLHQTRAGRAGPGVTTEHARTLDTRCGGHWSLPRGSLSLSLNNKQRGWERELRGIFHALSASNRLDRGHGRKSVIADLFNFDQNLPGMIFTSQ